MTDAKIDVEVGRHLHGHLGGLRQYSRGLRLIFPSPERFDADAAVNLLEDSFKVDAEKRPSPDAIGAPFRTNTSRRLSPAPAPLPAAFCRPRGFRVRVAAPDPRGCLRRLHDHRPCGAGGGTARPKCTGAPI